MTPIAATVSGRGMKQPVNRKSSGRRGAKGRPAASGGPLKDRESPVREAEEAAIGLFKMIFGSACPLPRPKDGRKLRQGRS